MRLSYTRVAYAAVVVVLVAMLIGTNYKLASQRDELRARDELLLKTAVVLNGRMADLEGLMERAEKKRLRLLGLRPFYDVTE